MPVFTLPIRIRCCRSIRPQGHSRETHFPSRCSVDTNLRTNYPIPCHLYHTPDHPPGNQYTSHTRSYQGGYPHVRSTCPPSTTTKSGSNAAAWKPAASSSAARCSSRRNVSVRGSPATTGGCPGNRYNISGPFVGAEVTRGVEGSSGSC